MRTPAKRAQSAVGPAGSSCIPEPTATRSAATLRAFATMRATRSTASIDRPVRLKRLTANSPRPLPVAGTCEPEDGDMSYLLQAADSVRWVPELSRSVRPWRNLKALWRLWRLLRCERPTIVHTHTAMAGCLGRLAAVLSGAPIVIHTFHGNSLNEYFSRFRAGVFRRVEQLLARFTDALC